MDLKFRKAVRKDIPLILSFIKDLAEYEQMLDQVLADELTLEQYLFGEKAYAEVVFAVCNGSETGFALFFHNFSTFLGRPGIYLEDLYVKEDYRGKGIGKKLLAHISSIAMERGCGRVEWWVLNWNPARHFYKSLGAEAMDEWTVYRLSGKAMERLASEADAKH